LKFISTAVNEVAVAELITGGVSSAPLP